MSTAGHQGLVQLASAAIGLMLVSMALWGSRRAWLSHYHPVDRALNVAALVWLIHLLVTTSLAFTDRKIPLAYITHLGYQVLIISVMFFLLTSAGIAGKGVGLMLVMQAVAGGAALHWYHRGGNAQAQAWLAWVAINLLSVICFTLAVAYRVYLTRSFPCWLALAGSLIGLGLGVDDVLPADDAQQSAMLLHYFYAAFLLVVWHLIKQRGEGPGQHRGTTSDFQSSSNLEDLTGFGATHDFAASAVASERHRIAQDLHDGVGSQIVNILSTLDSHSPHEQAVALALEQCLADLKMTVDAIDSANDNALEALGRLRYRVQHSLDKLGIRMLWKVEICGELEAVRGEQAQQVLRIAQECLSNVMRHANASVVGVVLRFVPETNSLVLEVHDNGQGIGRGRVGRTAGKGLKSMRRRAQTIGGELRISSRAGAGTRVRFVLPLAESSAQSSLFDTEDRASLY
jgi:signal transduction histidine kinase